jgi:hypothetical protein
MSAILIHAGMPKTGSSSIQEWLIVNNARLRDYDFTVVVAPPSKRGDIAFVPFEEGQVKSEWIIRDALRKHFAQVGRDLAAALRIAAAQYGNIIITGEDLAPLFASRNPALPALERLAMSHEVRIAYYARPQHTALEALWRERGYRKQTAPAAYVRSLVDSLRYASSRTAVWASAPRIDFQPVPFRRDLLMSGNVVADFASRFLGIEAGGLKWANKGLPLEVVNVLRASSSRSFAGARFSEERFWRCRALAFQRPLPDDDERIGVSRLILQKFAHETYSAENSELGWEDFVPAPDDPESIPGLEALDELWEPRASLAELALLLRALDAR